MKWRPFLLLLFMVALPLFAPRFAASQAEAVAGEAPARPNVLILMTDDMSRRCVGATGGEQALTPHIDALAARGTVLNNTVHQGAFSGAICTCSRAMLLTGRPVWSVTPGNLTYNGPARLSTADPLMPEQFGEAGWQTFGTGKWHNGDAALRRSFNHAEAIAGGMLPFNARDAGGARDNAIEIGMLNPRVRRLTDDGDLEPYTAEGWSTDVFYDAAESFLQDTWDGDRPFFMYVSTNAPHDPRHVPDDILARFESVTEPPNYLRQHPFDNGHLRVRDEMVYPPPHSPETVRRERAVYLAMCAQIDDRIGRLLAMLEEMGQLDNTIIVFTSDHGLAVGEHGLMGKQNLYDGSWRVPMILAGPGIPQGQTHYGFAYLHGLYPTLTRLAGLDSPAHAERFAFDELLLQGGPGHQQLFGVYTPNAAENAGVRCVREGRYKLLRYTHSGRVQLFDLEADPWETNDLIGDPAHTERVKHLGMLLDRWMAESGDPLGRAD